MFALLLVGFVAAVAYIVHLSVQGSELRYLILWYRRALAERNVDWREVERGCLVAYTLQPELRPGGAYREGQVVADTEFITQDDAHATISRFQRWWQRVRTHRRN